MAEYKYKVFAAYKSDSRHIMERFNSGKEEANRKAYLESIMDNRTMGAQIDENAQVTADSKLLTLSTHDDSDPEGRFLVQAYLVEKEEKSNFFTFQSHSLIPQLSFAKSFLNCS